jgi:hypothetical protein
MFFDYLVLDVFLENSLKIRFYVLDAVSRGYLQKVTELLLVKRSIELVKIVLKT